MASWISTSVRVSTELGGLVEDEDRWVGEEGARDGEESCSSPATRPMASSSDDRIGPAGRARTEWSA